MTTNTATTYYTWEESPVGRLLLTSDGSSLTSLYMGLDHKHSPTVEAGWIENSQATPFAETLRQLRAYFAGESFSFDLPLSATGTDFQTRVWRELLNIPFGETISYGELARRIGDPNASRAVGLANGRNPVSIVVPCHRVIGANGKLTGYGGGLPRKEALLAYEAGVLRRGPHPMPAMSFADPAFADPTLALPL